MTAPPGRTGPATSRRSPPPSPARPAPTSVAAAVRAAAAAGQHGQAGRHRALVHRRRRHHRGPARPGRPDRAGLARAGRRSWSGSGPAPTLAALNAELARARPGHAEPGRHRRADHLRRARHRHPRHRRGVRLPVHVRGRAGAGHRHRRGRCAARGTQNPSSSWPPWSASARSAWSPRSPCAAWTRSCCTPTSARPRSPTCWPRLDEHVAGNDHFEFYWMPYTDRTLTKSQQPGAEPTPSRAARFSSWFNDDLLENTVLGGVCRLVPGRAAADPDAAARHRPGASRPRVYTERSDLVFTSPRRVSSSRWSTGCRAPPCPRRSPSCAGSSTACRSRWRCRSRCGSPPPTTSGSPTATAATTRTSPSTSSSACRTSRTSGRFEAVCDAARRAAALGQDALPRRRRRLRPAYPHFDDFLAVRDKLDPDRVFANDYTRPDPRRLRPALACAEDCLPDARAARSPSRRPRRAPSWRVPRSPWSRPSPAGGLRRRWPSAVAFFGGRPSSRRSPWLRRRRGLLRAVAFLAAFLAGAAFFAAAFLVALLAAGRTLGPLLGQHLAGLLDRQRLDRLARGAATRSSRRRSRTGRTGRP